MKEKIAKVSNKKAETIKVRNMTTLTDFSALTRAALYISGHEKEAMENGFSFNVRNRFFTGKTVTVMEN